MCSSKGHISEVVRPITSLYLGEEMTDKDFKNMEDIQRILKYLDKGKLDVTAWPNALELKVSLDRLLNEHKEYMAHMEHHH